MGSKNLKRQKNLFNYVFHSAQSYFLTLLVDKEPFLLFTSSNIIEPNIKKQKIKKSYFFKNTCRIYDKGNEKISKHYNKLTFYKKYKIQYNKTGFKSRRSLCQMIKIKKENKLIKRFVILITILGLLFIFKGIFFNSLKIFDMLISSMNNKLMNVRSTIYKKELDFKERIDNINYLNKYNEKYNEINTALQEEKIKNVELKNLIVENQNLKNMLALRQQSPQEYIASNVALVENINESERIFIDKGSDEGLLKGLPVLYNGMLIGKIGEVSKDFSEVILITSKKSRISVILNGGDLQILRGNGDGTYSILNYNGNGSAVVQKFYKIETSGISDLFPKGLLIGSFYLKDIDTYKKKKEIVFKAPFKLSDMRQVMVYKFDNNKLLEDNIIQNQKIQQEIDKNRQFIKDR